MGVRDERTPFKALGATRKKPKNIKRKKSASWQRRLIHGTFADETYLLWIRNRNLAGKDQVNPNFHRTNFPLVSKFHFVTSRFPSNAGICDNLFTDAQESRTLENRSGSSRPLLGESFIMGFATSEDLYKALGV